MQPGVSPRSRQSSNAAISGLFVALGLMAAAAIALFAGHVEGANIGAGAFLFAGQVMALAILLGSSEPYGTTRKVALALVAIAFVFDIVAPLVGAPGLVVVALVLPFLSCITGLVAAMRRRGAT